MVTTSKSKKKRSYSRPGVEASIRLAENFLHNPSSIWEKTEEQYYDMLHFKGGEKLSSLDRKCDELRDKIMNFNIEKEEENDIEDRKPSTLSTSLHEPFITSDELYKVVEWKFSKGKPRHALWKHLKANTEKNVQVYSRRAFSKVRTRPINDDNDIGDNESLIIDDDDDDIRGAMEELTKLKGVGPATASAVLSLYRPDLFTFMDDEVIECLYENQRGYTLKIYLDINSRCRHIARRLGKGWNGRRVGRALWTASQLYASGEGNDLTLGDVYKEGKGEIATDNDKSTIDNDNDSVTNVMTACKKKRKYN